MSNEPINLHEKFDALDAALARLTKDEDATPLTQDKPHSGDTTTVERVRKRLTDNEKVGNAGCIVTLDDLRALLALATDNADEPSEAMWGGLARDIMMWLDFGTKTPRELFKHLKRTGRDIPKWLTDEPEMRALDHVPSKGTRCVIIYKAMQAARGQS